MRFVPIDAGGALGARSVAAGEDAEVAGLEFEDDGSRDAWLFPGGGDSSPAQSPGVDVDSSNVLVMECGRCDVDIVYICIVGCVETYT